jgi:transglutaminase-like putative cysteine protease
MLFQIVHRTRYCYDGPVYFDPHEVRLRPRCDWSQRVLDFRLEIEPEPASIAHNLDADGNLVARAWFAGAHKTLRITTHATVETLRSNPFDFLLSDDFAVLPAKYAAEEAAALVPFRQTGVVFGPVLELGRELLRQTEGKPLLFLRSLNGHIYTSLKTEVRLEGRPLAAEETLARGRGACRDLAVLFVAVCRAVGLAARFVSGYQAGVQKQQERYMHAWAEVYLPGAGWRAWDPSLGLAVADAHVAVAVGGEAGAALPLIGHIRGENIKAELEASIQLETNG